MGLLDRLFGGDKMQQATASGPIAGELAMKIVNAFGGAMEDGPVPGTVADVKSLPYPKDQIKAAIRYALSVTSDKAMREQLVQGYIFLADYQGKRWTQSCGVRRERSKFERGHADPSEAHAAAARGLQEMAADH